MNEKNKFKSEEWYEKAHHDFLSAELITSKQ